MFRLQFVSSIWLFASLGWSSWATAAIDFNRDIRPILADKCFACHGPDANKREADLRLDHEAGAKADRDGSPVIVAGKPSESELLRRLTTEDPDERMPPASSEKKLTSAQIELIRQWIAEGAKYDRHWSLIPPSRRELPSAGTSWARNAIDRFIAAGHELYGLRPSADADRRTLARRLSFDLTGLPPAPELVDRFVNDSSPDAYESLVDQFLASPHYGERMAMYWLDVVRYADSGGYHSDNEREVWPYRDYVIRSFNENRPFDQFTIEQIAGDLVPGSTTEQKIASGYNRLLQTTEEGGAQPKEYAAKYQADRVRNTAVAWLGLTMGCCECHDHKYDPLSIRDFYSFAAFFADVKEKAVGRQDQTPLPTPEQERQLRQLDADLNQAREQKDEKKITQLEQRKKELEQSFARSLITISVPPRKVRVLPRGNWMDDSGDEVQPAFPAALSSAKVENRPQARLELGRWIVSRDNPLTARVFVNRVWKLFFGQGIVKTLDDFGTQGANPTHPELLDWLSVDFMESGWNVKQLVKQIVMSRTYQQGSQLTPLLAERDPQNQWLARQSYFRLDAEMIRDNALAISGLLQREVGGRSVKPYQPAGYWRFLNFPTREWTNDRGPSQYRRGLYTHWQRTFLHPSLLAFDAPSREECTVERPRSNTPLQALVLLNDPTYVEAARVFAAKIITQGGSSTSDRLRFTYRQSLNREPTEDEQRILAALVEKHVVEFSQDAEQAKLLQKVGDSPAAPNVDPAELAAWTSVARAIFNLHETITRR